jgi:ACS family glucarate transporter-like MFS transporter
LFFAAPKDQLTASAASASSLPMKNHVRYFIVFMLFFVSSVNYADRATLSITKTSLSQQFRLDSVWMGYLLSAWAWSYVAAQLPAGWLLDRFGSKLVYGAGILLWSSFVFLMGFAGYLKGPAALLVLFALLFLTGFALAPAFPGNGRFVANWFPTAERGTASAIFNSAQYFSLVLFAPFMGWLTHRFGWQSVFWVMGGLGIVLTPLWFGLVYSPREHPRVSAAELRHIEEGGALVNMEMGGKSGARFNVKWSHVRQLLCSRMLVGVYLGQFCISTLTYFFIQWFPGYLESRGMSILKVGLVAALPALCGCAGGILGGTFSDALLKRGCSLSFARKLPIVLGMLLSCVMIVCNYVRGNSLVVVIMCLAFFGKGFGALGWTVVADTSPKEIMGLSGGLFNTFGNSAGITTAIVIGYLIKGTGGFAAALVFVGANALGAIVCYLLVVGEIKRLELTKPQFSNRNTHVAIGI